MMFNKTCPSSTICTCAPVALILLGMLALGCNDAANSGDSLQEGYAAEDEQVASSEQGIVYGTVTQERPEVAALPYLGCTATMLNSRTFLTASSCIGNVYERRGDLLSINYNTSLAANYTIDRAITLFGTGLAVGRLVSPVPATVLPSAAAFCSTPLPVGMVTALGYGCNVRYQSNWGTKRYTQFYFTGSGASQNLCPGDIGGPLFPGLLGQRGCLARVAAGIDGFGGDMYYDVTANQGRISSSSAALWTSGVVYRTHVQGLGWQDPVTNGATAGTTNQARQLEALQIWSPISGARICYRGFVQNIAWQNEVCEGAVAGTVGAGLRMEAFTARLDVPGPFAGIRYRAYLQGVGWQGWVSNGQLAGTTGQGRRIEAVQIEVYN